MRRGVILLSVVVMSLIAMLASAQNTSSSPPASDRKIASRIAPVYPDLARRMHIRGVVKVEAIVRANGVVKSTRVLGGNPVLVDAALDAVGKWKFEAAQTETTETVQVSFEGQ
jgi:TonB family protein